jgi:undecaprenyl diphosphate synthase
MDGNRRWAKQKGLPVQVGHWKGAEALTKVVDAAIALGVQVLTVYAFSTENWNRSLDEVSALMHLFKMYLNGQKRKMIDGGVRLSTIGDISRLPQDVRDVLMDIKQATSMGSKLNLVIALNYGARDDIRRAAVVIANACVQGHLNADEITEEVISKHLDTAEWRDPELLIRTSGEMRVSNFLLWQISYAEVYVTEVLWPDFDEQELERALLEYQKREKRAGV